MPSPPAPSTADLARLLFRHGTPATVLTPEGLLPCVFSMFRAEDEPSFDRIVSRFGGMFVGGWDAVDANGFVWVGYGRAATIATRCITRLPEFAAHRALGPLTTAWQALDTFAELWRTVPAGPDGRRPHAVYQSMQHEAGRLTRLLGEVDGVYEEMTSVIETAISGPIARGEDPGELLRPTDDELAGLPDARFDARTIAILDAAFQPRITPPMDPADLAVALGAYAEIEAMSPAERERRVRRQLGEGVFHPDAIAHGMAHADLLFMGWAGDHWRDLTPKERADRVWRATNAMAAVRATHTAGLAKPMDAGAMHPHSLWALATATLHGATLPRDLESLRDPRAQPPGAPSWDQDDLIARLTGVIGPDDAPARPKARRKRKG